MGFCLFETVAEYRLYAAVNPAFVEDVKSLGSTESGYPISELILSENISAQPLRIFGKDEEVWAALKKGAKIALQPADLRVFSGRGNLKNRPLRMNNLGRVALVLEVFPDALEGITIDTTTASYMYLEDGKSQLIAERPGLFAFRANLHGDIPAISYQ